MIISMGLWAKTEDYDADNGGKEDDALDCMKKNTHKDDNLVTEYAMVIMKLVMLIIFVL